MKKLLLSFVLILVALTSVQAQTSVSLYYDFGKMLYRHNGPRGNNLSSRYELTSTVEHFSADKWGSTYFFVDMYYGNTSTAGHKNGCIGGYWEFGRDFCFWQNSKLNWLSAHIEYNGGMDSFAGGTYADAWLIGPKYNGHSKDFSKTWSLGVFYKAIPHADRFAKDAKKSINSFQVTGVWGINFCKNMLTFSGFFDVWYENTWFNPHSNISFITEPQFWFNINALKGCKGINLSIGTEVELSNNFVGCGPGFYCNPTLAVKWTF